MKELATNPHYNYLVNHGLYFEIELRTTGNPGFAHMYLVSGGERANQRGVQFLTQGKDRKTLMLEAPCTKEWTDLDCALRMLILINQEYHTDEILDDFWNIRQNSTYRNPRNQ